MSCNAIIIAGVLLVVYLIASNLQSRTQTVRRSQQVQSCADSRPDICVILSTPESCVVQAVVNCFKTATCPNSLFVCTVVNDSMLSTFRQEVRRMLEYDHQPVELVQNVRVAPLYTREDVAQLCREELYRSEPVVVVAQGALLLAEGWDELVLRDLQTAENQYDQPILTSFPVDFRSSVPGFPCVTSHHENSLQVSLQPFTRPLSTPVPMLMLSVNFLAFHGRMIDDVNLRYTQQRHSAQATAYLLQRNKQILGCTAAVVKRQFSTIHDQTIKVVGDAFYVTTHQISCGLFWKAVRGRLASHGVGLTSDTDEILSKIGSRAKYWDLMQQKTAQ